MCEDKSDTKSLSMLTYLYTDSSASSLLAPSVERAARESFERPG
jgi:hypothetical protein